MKQSRMIKLNIKIIQSYFKFKIENGGLSLAGTHQNNHISMSQKHEDRLQTLDELFNYNLKVTKACTMGIIIDVTSPYLDEDKGHYIQRIKIIDPSFNMTKSINGLKFGYCTVTIYAKRPDELPNPRVLGDLLYLRRFAFEKYNDHFQSHSHKKDFCYWVLLDGSQDAQGFANYQSSRLNVNMQQSKFQSLIAPIQELRSFGRKFLENNSIAKVVASGLSPKDEDWVVKLVLKGSQGKVRLMRGDQQYTIFDVPTNMTIGDYGKLRSVARVQDDNGQNIIIKNNFTSLVKMHEWMFDAQNAIKANDKIIDESEQGLYTNLDTLLSTSPANCANKTYWVRCEIFSISANTFSGAVKYFDAKKNQIFDTPHKGTQPVYKLALLCQDSSLKKQFAQVWVFSYDGKGGNLVKNVNLAQLNEYSSMIEEQALYHKRYDELLEAESVVMMIQCLVDGKGNKLLRAVDVK